jgi:hypothetical protein
MSQPLAVPEFDSLAIAEAVVAEALSQPELFGPSSFSKEELAIVRIARKGCYNGARTRDEARVSTVVALRQQGCSLSEIERRTGMDTRLISIVVKEAERHRVVPAIRDMVTRRLAETTELVLDRLDATIRDPEADPQMVRALGVVAGIGADKVSAGAGPIGDLHLHQHVHLAGSDSGLEYLKQRAAALTTESESASTASKAPPIEGFHPDDAGLAASGDARTARIGATIDVAAEPVDPAAAAPAGPGAAGPPRGGGPPAGAGGSHS